MTRDRSNGLIILIFILFSLIVFGNVLAENTIDFVPETGDYRIGYYQENGEYFETIFEPATKIYPLISSYVYCENDTCNYGYIVKNLETSKQRLVEIFISFSKSLFDVGSPDLSWTYMFFKYSSIISWGNSKGESGLRDIKDGIAPDSAQGGFNFKSKGLPSIVSCYFMGGISGNFALTEDAPLEVLEFIDAHEKFPANTVKCMNIGPKDPPNPFTSSVFLDTLIAYDRQCLELGWIKSQISASKYENYFETIKDQLQQNNLSAARFSLQNVLRDVESDSGTTLTNEAYALLRYNTEYLLNQLPQTSHDLSVHLVNSQGILITGASLQYYESSWKTAQANGDGTFTVDTDFSSVKLRMTFEHGVQEKSNVQVNGSVVVFKTIPANVRLKDSQGELLDPGTVQYYAGGWYDLAVTSNGIARKELLPANYKFRMIYSHASSEKYQDIGVDSIVVFQTVPARVELRNSQSALIDTGTVKYYSGAWYDLGSTSGGVATMELLPFNYKFRMTYAKGSNEKYQDIGSNPTVTFQTANARVELRDSQGNLIDGGAVKYYSGAWYDLGATSGGVAAMELLPFNYKFRMTYANGSNEKYQDIGVNPVVPFPTVPATVRVTNIQGQLLNNVDVKYYSGAWYPLGLTSNGVAIKELLPFNYKFRVTAGTVQSEKYQDISTNPIVQFNLNVP
jgi:hypothetical protein